MPNETQLIRASGKKLPARSVKSEISNLPKTDYCGIHTYAFITGQTPEQVWPILEPYFNRVNPITGTKGRGIDAFMLIGLLRRAGYNVDLVDEYSSTNGKKDHTWGTMKKALSTDKGTYIAIVDRHVIGVSGGKYVDTGATKDTEQLVTFRVTR